VHRWWHGTHRYDIQVLATHVSTWVHRYSSLLQWSLPLGQRGHVAIVGRILCTKCTLHSNHRLIRVILLLKCDGIRAETRFCLSAKRTSPFKSVGGVSLVDYWPAEVCASAVVMLDTPCSVVVWRVLATHSIRQFPLHFPSHASPCAITFQLDSTPTHKTTSPPERPFSHYIRSHRLAAEMWTTMNNNLLGGGECLSCYRHINRRLFTHDTDRYTNAVSYRSYVLQTVTGSNNNHPVHIIQGQDP